MFCSVPVPFQAFIILVVHSSFIDTDASMTSQISTMSVGVSTIANDMTSIKDGVKNISKKLGEKI